MGWYGVTDENGRMLRRVIALLLALAGLAESASLRSPAIRAAVLWLLRPGEEIATAYLAALTGRVADRAVPAWYGPAGDGAEDALRLACVFRALAAALAALLAAPAAGWQAGSARVVQGLLAAERARQVVSSAATGLRGAIERRDSS